MLSSLAAFSMDSSIPNDFSAARVDALKKSMTLNFVHGNTTGLLDSPDLKLFQLTSPDLESLLFQQNGLLTQLQTPTPGTLMRMISGREDDKSESRSFEEALAKLNSQRPIDNMLQFSESDNALGHAISDEPQPSLHSDPVELVYSRAPSKRPFNEKIIDHANSSSTRSGSRASAFGVAVNNEDESQCSSGAASMSAWSDDETYSIRSVPREGRGSMRSSLGAKASGLEPVDLGAQEKMRMERKRERNRVAARKCRERKIRKIDELTLQVQKLENEKKNMGVRLNRMQAEVSRLRSVIQDHAHAGCKVPLSGR